MAGGHNGNIGSVAVDGGVDPADLLRRANELLQPRPRPDDDAATLRAAAAETRRRVDEAWDLALAAADLADAEWRETVARRRVERQLGAVQRRARLEERRAAGDMYAGEERTPNRPTHVDVDPQAWATVKQRSFERGLLVASAVAELVVRAVDEGVTPQRNPQRPRSTARRFARVFVDDETWGAFRARAVEADVTVARLVGLIVEAEARRLGWRPGVGR